LFGFTRRKPPAAARLSPYCAGGLFFALDLVHFALDLVHFALDLVHFALDLVLWVFFSIFCADMD
jgi:hypothetical protein